MNENTIQMLADVGLNRLEALIYLHLTHKGQGDAYERINTLMGDL